MFAFLLLSILWTLTSAVDVHYYELEGHHANVSFLDVKPGYSQANQAAVEQISQTVISILICNWSLAYIRIHGVEAGMPTAIFHGYLTTSSLYSRDEIIAMITKGDDVKLYYLSKIGSLPPSRGIEESPAVFNCSNGGILLPNSTCVCPPFVSGPQCDVISCQNFGILDKNRCTCPPGFYALNCETRGCVPSVQSNLDTTHQSFILVLNLRSTMAYDLHQLINQLPIWVSDIGKAAPDLIDNFILNTYLQYKNSYYMKNEIFTSSDALLDYLNGVVISTGDTDQPTISAINSVQSFSSLMHPASVVYVFADSAASDATSFNPKLSSSSPEMLAIQRTLAWRNKLAIFLSETDSDPVDYFGDYFDGFRRLVRATQGDLIVFEKTSMTELIDQLLPYYYQMENMATLYGVNPQDDIEVPIRADYDSQVVYILVTAENATVPGVLDQNGIQPKTEASGKYYKLIRTTATATTMITVTAKKQSSVNIRVWINSPNTVFIGSSSDPAVDVGSTVVSSEIDAYTTAYVGGFTSITNLTYARYDVAGKPIGLVLNANLSREPDCTFPYIFPSQPGGCMPGAFVQELTFSDGSNTFRRMVPGFCAQLNQPSPVPMKCFNGGTLQGGSVCNCTAFFYGPNCATPVCLNGGVQEKFPGNGRPLCQCPVGYGGDHCEVLSCSAPSSNQFTASKRSLAVVIQSSFSQAQLNSHIVSGLTSLLKFTGQADAFDEYIVSTFNTITIKTNQSHEVVFVSHYPDATSFLNATTSASVMYQNSQSISQPSTAALLQTINSISYDKSSIFLFTDAIPVANTQRTDVTNIVVAAIERQLQINIVVTAPYQMNELCIQSSDAAIYSLMALQTGGTIVNLCQPYFNSYPRDIITEFFTGYGMTHHHVETLQETVVEDCSVLFVTDFFVDDPTTQVYAFVNSDEVEAFDVHLINSDLSTEQPYQLPSLVQMPFLGIYEIMLAVQNTGGYALQVQSMGNSTKGPCSVRIVEKTQLAVYLAFTSDPSKDSPFLTLNYGITGYPVVHVSSQFQSDSQPSLLVQNSDGSYRYSSTATRRLPSCHYENFFAIPLTCYEISSNFIATITIRTSEMTVQRAQRAYCFYDAGTCLNGGSENDDGSCSCPTNFEGPVCEYPICLNGATVKDNKCICAPGYIGQFCQFVACDNWNYLETHDVRQHEFRQITFVIERNIGMVMPTIYLQQMIANFVNSSESNDIPKQYSLVTFDENVITRVISTSHADRFLDIFENSLTNFTNTDPASTKLVDAVQEAYKITIQPPSIIFAFTSHNADRTPTSFLKQRLGTQVNVFYMQQQDYPQQPSGFAVSMIARQSGGRLLPLTVLAARSFSNVLISAMSENALIYDDGFQDCSDAQTVNFFVESTATRVVMDITGNDVSSSGAVTVLDGAGNTLPISSANVLLSDSAALIVEFVLSTANRNGGQWTASVKTTSGSCFIQVRAESPIHVIPGFTSSQDHDFVKSGPFSKLGTNASVYVTTRVTNSLYANFGVTMDSLNVAEADFSAPWNDKILVGQSLHPRDPSGCASQFVTEVFMSPSTTYQRYVVMGTDANKTKFQRTFFFSQPTSSDSAAQCVHGTRNTYGECVCDDNHVGDYCSNRVCVNGGTSSVGVCVCLNGYYGDFCEIALRNTTGTSTEHVYYSD
uniref:EGF-like domain-containing protein n=1 Tax=Haemonchus contortus TaxID=6289 RepID=A0A7I4YRC2_HAECO